MHFLFYAKTSTVLKETELCGQQFAVYGTPQEPLFKAADVAKWINHSDVSMMIRKVDEDEKLIQTLFVSGQNRETWFLTEDGLYEVLMQSRKPIAKQFKKGVKQILKQIRTSGSYTALLSKSRENREDDDDLMSYPTIEEYFKQFVPLDYFIDMLMALMKDCTEMADWLNSENRDKVYHRVSVLLTFTKVLQATYRRGTFA